jgi:hypothetical protein
MLARRTVIDGPDLIQEGKELPVPQPLEFDLFQNPG